MACRTCDAAAKKGDGKVKDHDCRVNWGGSSKGMESSVAVEMLNNIKDNSFQISTLIGDDDSTTMAMVRQQVEHSVEKWSDTNHAKKSLGSRLYKLQKQEKALTTPVIKYLQKCFAYALCQNKHDPSGVKDAIDSIVPHAFGEHDKCGSWCKFLKNPIAKYSSLPNGVGLHGESLRAELTKVFLVFAQNAKKLAPCGSTLPNESFNNTVASKAPKARHYSGSESLVYRVKAAACQKNIGHDYVSEVR